ncbi:hypothetical protein HanIR_Chr15g0755691 [Helianthus annuus]|nr:hypothetical protein HanIR_Chr15g0755691 [Helianthus annuus]
MRIHPPLTRAETTFEVDEYVVVDDETINWTEGSPYSNPKLTHRVQSSLERKGTDCSVVGVGSLRWGCC